MIDHYPTTPEEFNFQAELKAASHWHWPKDDKEEFKSVVAGYHDNCRLITAVKKTLIKWYKELDLPDERLSTTRGKFTT